MNTTFFTFTENVIGELEGLGRTWTAKNYRASLNSFKRYKKTEDMLTVHFTRLSIAQVKDRRDRTRGAKYP